MNSVKRPNLALELIAGYLGFDEFGVPVFIHAMHRKNVLGEINSNRDNSHDFPLLVVLMKSRNSIMARLMPFAATSPQPRNGEARFIH